MVAQKYKDMLQKKSVIRTLSEFATKRGQEIGYENVFDYSLGNPSVPVVQDYTDNTIRLLQTKTSSELHGYSPSVGLPSFKEKVAASLNKRFDMNYTANHIFPTSGAAGALAHALRAVTSPGDDVLTFAPYFPEYNCYVGMTGANLRVVPANTADFQVDFEQFEKMLADLQAQYADTAARMEKLKAQDKTRTATYRQLMGQKLTLGQMLETYRVYGLLE